MEGGETECRIWNPLGDAVALSLTTAFDAKRSDALAIAQMQAIPEVESCHPVCHAVMLAGDCDSATGVCSCFAGYLGEDCSLSEAGWREASPLLSAQESAV